MTASALFLVEEQVIPYAKLNAVASTCGAAVDSAALATCSGKLDFATMSATYETVLSIGSHTHHTVQFLGAVATVLAPGGKLIIKSTSAEVDSEALLKKSLLLAGFTSTSVSSDGSLSASKPNWQTGTKAAISLKPRTTPANGGPSSAAWTLNPNDDGDDDLIYEDELLTEADLARPAPANGNGTNKSGADDCEVGASGRKACANCTCGRAAAGEDAPQVKLTQEMLDNPQPSGGCGSCSLGDAFRCAGCPYKGLPAFEVGKKIELPPDFLLADV